MIKSRNISCSLNLDIALLTKNSERLVHTTTDDAVEWSFSLKLFQIIFNVEIKLFSFGNAHLLHCKSDSFKDVKSN